jgi:hypothetical protein
LFEIGIEIKAKDYQAEGRREKREGVTPAGTFPFIATPVLPNCRPAGAGSP